MKTKTRTVTKTSKEIHLTAEEFKAIDHKRLEKYLWDNPTHVHFVFENGSASNDEICNFRRKRVYLSSWHSGIVQWFPKKRQYAKMYYGTTIPIGQLVRVEITYSKELSKLLESNL